MVVKRREHPDTPDRLHFPVSVSHPIKITVNLVVWAKEPQKVLLWPTEYRELILIILGLEPLNSVNSFHDAGKGNLKTDVMHRIDLFQFLQNDFDH
jgi:hypothetical protein